MSKKKKTRQYLVECPKCFNHFHIFEDTLNRLCTRCNQWRPLLDFTTTRTICRTCLGMKQSRLSTQIRLRTKSGELLKQCTKCALWKPETSYAKDNDSNDGLQNWCIDCNNIYRANQRKSRKESDAQIRKEHHCPDSSLETKD